jgi:hypothetical protein
LSFILNSPAHQAFVAAAARLRAANYGIPAPAADADPAAAVGDVVRGIEVAYPYPYP